MSGLFGFNSALNGIQTGMNEMYKHAASIASASTMQGGETGALAESLVGLKASKNQVQASMQVVKTVDEVIGTLLDIKV